MAKKEYYAKILPVIKAFSEGRTIQYRICGDKKWVSSVPESLFSFNDARVEYRIEPEPRVLWIRKDHSLISTTEPPIHVLSDYIKFIEEIKDDE